MNDTPYFNAGDALKRTGEITFFNTVGERSAILRISKDGVWVNPDVPVEENARLFLDRIAYSIRDMVATAVAQEREACAQVVEEYPHWIGLTAKAEISNAIRARGNQ
jgi:hypothetical protein